MNDQKAIEVLDLRKRYEDTQAVDGVSFQVARGEIFGLLGPNGAGKTTTVECLLGLREPDGGVVRVLGVQDGVRSREIRARVGVQLQTTGLLNNLKVREQVALFAGLFPRALPIDDVLQRVGLTEKAKTLTKALSGGQKQRLAVALSMINDPDLIFLDEPTTGLDPQARRGLWEVIQRIRAHGKSVLLTTHYMEEAEALCDRVAIMDHGKIIEMDPPASMIHRHFEETAIDFVPLNSTSRDHLASLPGVTQIHSENGHMTLYSTDIPRTMASLFELVSDHRLAFRDLIVRQATLEDVFLKLTGRRIRT
ncbi:MAG: ATP-binding cassette domain-containing protein [Anaerolineales bacterium]|nr:ATP-binding cassette domain-containing protein [Anaerolineales bacterium]